MKNLPLLLILISLSLVCPAGKITQTYYFTDPKVKTQDGYQTISFTNTLLTGMAGEPALPYREIRLLLPPGEEAVAVNIRFEEENTLDGSYLIYPQQPSRPLSLGYSKAFYYQEDLYLGHEKYPAEQLGEFSTHFQNGHSILLSSFTPVRYIPATRQISYYSRATVEVTTRKTEQAISALENLGNSRHITNIAYMIQNPEKLIEYPVKETRDEGYQILVVTPQAFEADFEDYRMIYLIRGIKAEVVTIEDIQATGQGIDLQEKIRNYIIQEYQDNGIEYVLLGGDTEHVPFRGFYCYVDSGWGYEDDNIPADLYYSALDGTWNDDGDNRWGEIGEDDLLPDVSVARWPFSNLDQLERLIHKTGQYQDDPVTGELQRPLLAGEHLWYDPETWGGDYMDLLIGHHEDNGYITDGIPETDDMLKLYERDGGWGKWDLINAVNQGRNFIHHSGHANQGSVMKLDVSDITNQNFDQANGIDHNYTLVYTHGCLCGAFDENDCIAEAMVLIDNFAVAGAFNSRYGWFNEGQTEGPSEHLHREFVDALYDQQQNHVGTTHLVSKINTSTWVNAPGQHEEGALRWCFYDCNILGDPALAIWTGEPVSVDVQYTEEIPQGASTFTVTVTSEGQPLENMMCTLMSGNEMIGCCPTDTNGLATIQIPGGFDGEEAGLVVSGYHCYPHHYPVNVQVGITYTEKEGDIRLYPNPCKDHLNIEMFIESPQTTELSIYLLDGRLVGRYTFELQRGVNTFTLPTDEWPSGVLTVKATSINLDWITTIVHQ